MLFRSDRNHINTYFEQIREKTEFVRWFFGRHHINKLIPPKYYAVFDGVVDAEEDPKPVNALKKVK